MARLITQYEIAEMLHIRQCIVSTALKGTAPRQALGRFYKYDFEEAVTAVGKYYMRKRANHLAKAERWFNKAQACKDLLRQESKASGE